MRLSLEPEHALVAEAVRGTVAGWEGPLEPVFGEWWDEADAELAARLAALGWGELWQEGLAGAAVAGAFELGRAVAPLALLDSATLGGALALEGRVRHAGGGGQGALVERGTVVFGAVTGGEREATLDGLGTLRGVTVSGERVPDAEARLAAWAAATLAYLAGLADGALARAVAHVSAREQFGAPLGALPAVRGRLADASLIRDALLLCAWDAVSDPGGAWESLAWGGAACRTATGHALQVHGGIGFALEGGMHRFHRRAKSVQVWADAARAAL